MATTQELITASRCIDCGVSDGQKLSILIYQLTLLTGVSDVQTLINNARCIDCGISPGMQMSVLISQFDEIISGGGIGGGAEVFLVANGDTPVVVPDGGVGVAYDVAGNYWTYDGLTNNWNKIISA